MGARPAGGPGAATLLLGQPGAARHLEEALGGACPFGVSPRSLEKGLGRGAGRAARGSALLVARPAPREPGQVGIDDPLGRFQVGLGRSGAGAPAVAARRPRRGPWRALWEGRGLPRAGTMPGFSRPGVMQRERVWRGPE